MRSQMLCDLRCLNGLSNGREAVGRDDHDRKPRPAADSPLRPRGVERRRPRPTARHSSFNSSSLDTSFPPLILRPLRLRRGRRARRQLPTVSLRHVKTSVHLEGRVTLLRRTRAEGVARDLAERVRYQSREHRGQHARNVPVPRAGSINFGERPPHAHERDERPAPDVCEPAEPRPALPARARGAEHAPAPEAVRDPRREPRDVYVVRARRGFEVEARAPRAHVFK